MMVLTDSHVFLEFHAYCIKLFRCTLSANCCTKISLVDYARLTRDLELLALAETFHFQRAILLGLQLSHLVLPGCNPREYGTRLVTGIPSLLIALLRLIARFALLWHLSVFVFVLLRVKWTATLAHETVF